MPKPIAYIARTRAYYAALGYEVHYDWISHDTVPFTALERPLAESRIAIVTTAAPFQPGRGDQGPGAPYNGAAKFFEVYEAATDPAPDLRISHIAIDRDHTTAEDMGSYFPLAALQGAAVRAAPVFFGLPTQRSHRATRADADDLTARALAHGIDAAVLVPNCPVCHQSVGVAARHLEAAGVATVILGCARDILEHVGVPRFVFSDFPLGNGAGLPKDPASQVATLAMALRLLEEAQAPRAWVQNPLVWPGPANWREDYSNPDRLSPEELAARRASFDAQKQRAQAKRDA